MSLEAIHFQSGGQRLSGTLVTPDRMQPKNPGVIFFHGLTSSEKGYVPIAEQLAAKGIVGMTLSVRGHGSSEGDFNSLTFKDATEDGLSAYDYFAHYEFVDQSRIGLCGGSLGGAVASMISAQRDVASMLLRAPAVYDEKMMAMRYSEILSDEGQIFSKITNLSGAPTVRAIEEFKGKLLIITSEHDSIIPVSLPNHYMTCARNASQKEQIQIAGAGYELTGEYRKEFIRDTIDWFVKTLT